MMKVGDAADDAAADDAAADDAAADDAASDEAADDERQYSTCENGERIDSRYWCDNDCDCTGCEDEEDCKDGSGISQIDLGTAKVDLHLSHEGGKVGVMTKDIPLGVFKYAEYFAQMAYYCIFHGLCTQDDWDDFHYE